jgi:PhnB protein
MVVPYLTFDGKTEEAFSFYKSIFGGEFTSVQRFGDTPHGANLPAGDSKKIMHISYEIEKGNMLMGNDHLEAMGMGPFVPGNNFSLSAHPKSEDEAKRVFDALAAGGQVIMPIDKVFWGAYFGLLVDKFGIKWQVNYQYS